MTIYKYTVKRISAVSERRLDLDTVIGGIQDFFREYIWLPFTRFGWKDALDIAILAVLLYSIYHFFRGRRAGKFAVGLALIFLLYAFSGIFQLRALHRILSGIAPFSVILLAIIFQSELRTVLEKLGNSPLGIFSVSNPESLKLTVTINEVVDAACSIAMNDKDGALIVIERNTKLGEHIAKGCRLDAEVSSRLLSNIFIDRSSLHDGAVIISNNRIAAAGCKLPPTQNDDAVKGLGTRHSAAVGVSEQSDCVVVVVSEERHVISIASNGKLKRDYHRYREELNDEDKRKRIQNDLRGDIAFLLSGHTYDELLARNEKKAKEASEEQKKNKRRPKGRGRTVRAHKFTSDDIGANVAGIDVDMNGLDEVVERATERKPVAPAKVSSAPSAAQTVSPSADTPTPVAPSQSTDPTVPAPAAEAGTTERVAVHQLDKLGPLERLDRDRHEADALGKGSDGSQSTDEERLPDTQDPADASAPADA